MGSVDTNKHNKSLIHTVGFHAKHCYVYRYCVSIKYTSLNPFNAEYFGQYF